jgi:demethylmenaquinone methyltransferase/2-methoxy-6-polyprenyl-1,4-benzoquinol methylase
MPLYDDVNETISFGRARQARTYAGRKLLENRPRLILDSGSGPGSMSLVLLLSDAEAEIVAFDYSHKLLKTCEERLRAYRGRVHFIRGCFEELPFRSSSFDAIITAYALRDSTDLMQVIREYARSMKKGGRLAIVELAKPDNAIKRFFAIIYVELVAPLIAKVAIVGKMKSNPWRMIAPTYQNLPRTSRVLEMLLKVFEMLEKKEFLAGGMLVILLRAR